VEVADRIGVEPAAVAVDRASDRAGVRGEVQPAHVDQPARDAELGPHVVPAERGVGFRRGGDLVEAGEAGRGQCDTGANEELPAIQVGINAVDPAR
jgi:hypothetical protein